MRRRIVCLCILLTATAVACSVVGDGKVERIQPQFGLDDTLPSSTSILTTTSLFETTTTGVETTTTTPQPQTEDVRLYFVASGQLTYVLQPLASPVTLGQVIAALQSGPPAGDLGAGLRTVLPNFAEIRVTTDGSGIATVTLPDDFFDLVPGLNDQRLVIAQLVLTLTSSRGVGQVVFNLRVPLPTGQERPAGLQLTFSDYASMTDPNLDIPDPTLPAATSTTVGG